jgi:hypothetical protein
MKLEAFTNYEINYIGFRRPLVALVLYNRRLSSNDFGIPYHAFFLISEAPQLNYQSHNAP